MNEMDAIPIASSLLGACPDFLVFAVALTVAVSRWNKHPRVSMFVTSGLVLMFVTLISAQLLYALLPRHHSAQELMTLFMFIGPASSVLRSVGLALVLAAVFVERKQ